MAGSRSETKHGIERIGVRNVTRQTVLADRAGRAVTAEQKNTGLLKHTELEPGDGLWISGTSAVHTFFMKFPIDLVYLSKDLKVVKTRRAVGPWKLSGAWGAKSVLELPAGVIEESGTERGDQLIFERQGR